MADRDLVEYFIEHTNRRFDKLEAKVDDLMSFKLKIVGASLLLSTIISVVAQVFF